MEQLVPDMMITRIDEGTKGVQALDLLGRKGSSDAGARLQCLIGLIVRFIAGQASNPAMGRDRFVFKLATIMAGCY